MPLDKLVLPNIEVVDVLVVAAKGDGEPDGLAKEDNGFELACRKGEACEANPAMPELLKAEDDVACFAFSVLAFSPASTCF